MTFTRKKLAAITSGTLLLGAASMAGAAVLIDPVPPATVTPLVYASEIDLTASTPDGVLADDQGATDPQDVTGTLNVNATPAGTDLRVIVTLGGGATFTNAPTMDDITDTLAAAQSFPILTGGAGQSTVTFAGNSGGGFAAAVPFNIDVNGVTVTDKNGVTVAVTVQSADNFGPTTLTTHPAVSYITFGPALSVTYTPNATADNIDVEQDSLFFSGATGDVNVTAGTVAVAFDGTRLMANSLVVPSADTILTDSLVLKLTADNGLAAFDQATGSIVFDGVTDPAITIAGSVATGAAIAGAAAVDTWTVIGTVPAANAVTIDETGLVASTTATAEAGWLNTTINTSGSLADLERNGSSARLTFALTPGGVYQYYVRITNPAAIAGAVTMTLTNDDGDTSTAFGIGNIAGQTGNVLAAGASTKLLAISDIYAAAQAADPTFALGTNGDKLRVNIDAAFGANGSETGVVMNAFSLSTDGNSFFMSTNAAD